MGKAGRWPGFFFCGGLPGQLLQGKGGAAGVAEILVAVELDPAGVHPDGLVVGVGHGPVEGGVALVPAQGSPAAGAGLFAEEEVLQLPGGEGIAEGGVFFRLGRSGSGHGGAPFPFSPLSGKPGALSREGRFSPPAGE